MKQGFVLVVVLAASLIRPFGRAAAETPTEKRLRQLEEKLRQAEEEIRELKGQVQQQRAVGQATQRQAEQADEQAKTASAAAQKGVELPDWLKRTAIFGDVRVRHEGFYHQPHLQGQVVNARNRDRVRARLGFRFTYSDELSATIRGASGDINNPVSTNETLTGNFNRKNFNLDWAYLTFAPGASFGMRPGVLSINAGKFPNPIFRAGDSLIGQLVFDDDLSPEGASETVSLLAKPVGPLDQVKIHALQWTFAEVANRQDGWMFGGQVNPSLHFGNVQVDAGLAQFWWLNPDLIAQALSRNTTAFTAAGAPVANSNFNGSLINTNLLVTKRIQPPQLRPGTTPAAFNAITGFQSGFNESNFTFAATVPHVVLAQPLRLFADYVYNWDAATDDAHGVMAGLRLGQTKTRGDWAVTGFWEHLGQEAVISAFTYDDFGNGGTNVEGPVAQLEYQLLNPLTLAVRSHFVNFINRPTGSTNPTLMRLQLDAMLKF